MFDEIARRWGTDKSSLHHGYMWFYEQLFSQRTEGSLLEIGVQHGLSIKMWEEALDSWRITGIDCNPACKDLEVRSTTAILIGSQSDPSFLSAVAQQRGPFNVIIDDGSHLHEDQATSLEVLWDALASGGTYVIEDLHTTFYGGGISVDYIDQLINKLNLGRFGHKCGRRELDRWAEIEPQLDQFECGLKKLTFLKSLLILDKY